MTKTIRKLFWVWQFEEEEQWLNEMAAKGLCLVSVGFCRYTFEECEPGEYGICMQLLKQCPTHPESEQYIDFLENTGAQHVGTFFRWVYFRRKSADGPFELFSDNASRAKYLTQVIRFILLITAMNFLFGIDNLILFFTMQNDLSLLGLLNIILACFGAFGIYRLNKKRKKIEMDGQLFE